MAQYALCLGSVLSSCRGGDLVLCLANHLHSVSGERLSLVLKRSQGQSTVRPRSWPSHMNNRLSVAHAGEDVFW